MEQRTDMTDRNKYQDGRFKNHHHIKLCHNLM